jgi:hypothetical protein
MRQNRFVSGPKKEEGKGINKKGGQSAAPIFKAGSRVAVLNSSPSTMFYQIYEVATGYENGFACVRSVERALGPVAEIDVGKYGWIYLDTNPTLMPGRTIQLYWSRHPEELRRIRVEGSDPANCARIRGALRRHLEPPDLLRSIPPAVAPQIPQPLLSPPLVLPPPLPVRLPP